VELYYECKVIQSMESNRKLNFEKLGFNVYRKKIDKENSTILYKCLLTDSNKLRIKKSEMFNLVKENEKPFTGDIFKIHCDGAVYNNGNEKTDYELSALTTIVFKNDKEIFRTTNVYEQLLDNNTVELLAVLIGIRYLISNEDKNILKKSKILISSDSRNLQEYIIRPEIISSVVKKCKLSKGSSYYSELMRELLNELNFYLNFLEIYCGWIKGHTLIRMTSNKDKLLNYTCDKKCKDAIYERLHQLNVEMCDSKFESEKQYKKRMKNEYKRRSETNKNGKTKSKQNFKH